jgi:glycosyltransferase involved in cell wall biosynthesis
MLKMVETTPEPLEPLVGEGIHVCVFATSLNIGGIERMRVNLIPALQDLGYKISLMLHRAEGPLLPQVPKDVEIISLDVHKAIMALPRAVRAIKQRQPDILLTSPIRNGLTMLAARRLGLLKGVKTKIITGIHNAMSEEAKLPKNWRDRFLPTVSHMLLPHADQVLAVAGGVADDLAECARIDRGKITVVYNPVITPSFDSRMSEPVDHPWFNKKDVPLIVGMGRLVRQKDYPTLMRAFAIVRSQRPCRLAFIGDGPDRTKLQEMAEQLGVAEDVSFVGYQPNPFGFLSRASLFVLSSIHEGCPNALIEAIGCGTPVVSTDCLSGPDEVLVDGEYGPLVPVGDHVAMAEAMAATLDAPLPPERLRGRAADFKAAKIAKDYSDVFQKVLKREPRP